MPSDPYDRACVYRACPGRLRQFVRRMGVWRGVLLFTTASTLIAFAITGMAMEIAGHEHRPLGYIIAFTCSVSIMPAMVAGLLSLIRRLDETENELYRLARTDELTDLPNRRALMEAAAEHVADARPVALLFIDIDHFKRVNDTYGHQTGDEILRQVTRALASQLGDDDLLCRYGGEEFAVLIRGSDAARPRALAEQIRRYVERTSIDAGAAKSLHVTISIGVACAPDARDAGIYQLIDQADRALYLAKHEGRNRIRAA
ncbi:diguanylate cyclase [Salinisphaera dokdonensis CL-ES53]|uniref:diguanylate cyclase n=1 Tax=Salinisphaera dokdonensis CL-ES53 TaxID=1304272 RepID=A0ABV2AWR2_9GAMM